MQSLNLSNIACPINYVRTKLKLESMQTGEILEVILDDGEAIESVSTSVIEDGNKILNKTQLENSCWNLLIEKQ